MFARPIVRKAIAGGLWGEYGGFNNPNEAHRIGRQIIRGCNSKFSESKMKQEKAAAPKGAAAVHIGRQCRPKNGVVTAFSGGFHIH